MRFRNSSSPTPYMSRTFQVRMILMIVALGAVIMGIKVTSNPAFWARWFPEEKQNQAAAEKENDVPPPERNTSPQLNKDEILIASVQEDSIETTTKESKTEVGKETSPLPELDLELGTATVEVDPERLLLVEDYEADMNGPDAEAFYYLLWHASRVPLEELTQSGQVDVSREALLASPSQFRGEPITITAKLRSLLPRESGPNIYKMERFFDAWVIPPASDNIPWNVVATEIDGELPVSGLISEDVTVEVTGYFFKIRGYAANSGLKLAPVLVANKIELVPAAIVDSTGAASSNPSRWLFIVFCCVFAVAIVSVYRSTVGSRRMRTHRKEYIEQPADLSAIQGEASIDPGKQLHELSETEHSET